VKTSDDSLVWYVAYGSNVLARRFLLYIRGASDDSIGKHHGARDSTPPRDDCPITIAHDLYFAGHSKRWGGPVAFLELEPRFGVATPGRAYLVTASQLEDVVAQENGLRQMSEPFGIPTNGSIEVVPVNGKYNAIIGLPDIDGVPALTLSTDRDLPRSPPTREYLATMNEGLAECSRERRVGRTEFGTTNQRAGHSGS